MNAEVLESLAQIATRPWMGIYLRVLAIALGYGAIVHIANIAGFGEKPWLEGPLAWRIGDLVYGPLNIAAAIGLWMRSHWGIILFFLAVGSQFVIYTVFIRHFAFTPEHRQTIYGLLGTEALLVAGFVVVWWLEK